MRRPLLSTVPAAQTVLSSSLLKGAKGKSLEVNYSGSVTLSQKNKVDVLDSNEYRQFITNFNATETAMLIVPFIREPTPTGRIEVDRTALSQTTI